MERNLLSAAAVVAVFTIGVSADAHIEVMFPATRYQFEPPSSNNQKTGPCATGTPSGIVTELQPGAEITVTWEEFINHPGHFRVALDMTGADAFADPSSENDMDVSGNVVAYIPDDGGSSFSHTFTLPDVECDLCTLQIMQVMTDKLPWGPANGNDIYYWCSDISLKNGAAAGGAGPTGSGGGGATGGAGFGGGDVGAGPASSNGNGNTADEGGCSLGAPVSGGTGWPAFVALLAMMGIVRRRQRFAGLLPRRVALVSSVLMGLSCAAESDSEPSRGTSGDGGQAPITSGSGAGPSTQTWNASFIAETLPGLSPALLSFQNESNAKITAQVGGTVFRGIARMNGLFEPTLAYLGS